ncbi:hypothetical protein M431DRAFT_98849, partial [Trichoderma harzianum CBS 226.95]
MDSGRTLLHVAAERGWEKLVAWCLDYIGQPEQGHKTNNSTDDDQENKSIRSNCDGGKVAERTQLLLTAKDYDGYTALHLAAKFGHLDVVRLITTAGNASAVVDATGPEAYRPLHFASEEGHHSVVKYLLESGWQPNQVNSDGATPLQVAIESKDHSKVVTALIE